jgi:hypothetical protein
VGMHIGAKRHTHLDEREAVVGAWEMGVVPI